MALKFLNRCGFRATSSGNGSFVVASALTGMQVPEDAASPAVVDGATYRYFAESDDKTQWEIGTGVYTTSDDTLTRAAITDNSSGGTSALSFSAAPQVFMGGPLANEIAFFGEEILTTGGSPVEFDPNCFVSLVTSGGTAGQEEISLPNGASGAHHLIVFSSQTAPTDHLVVNGLSIPFTSGTTNAELTGLNNYLLLRCRQTNSWEIAGFTPGPVLFTPAFPVLPNLESATQVLLGDTTNGYFLSRDPGLQFINEEVTTGGSPSVLDGEVSGCFVTTGGTQAQEDIVIDDGYQPNLRKWVYLSNQTDPADTVSLDMSNIVAEDGSALTSVILDSPDESFSLEWRYADSKWHVIDASPGVVTV